MAPSPAELKTIDPPAPAANAAADRRDKTWFAVLLTISVSFLWLLPANSSFWLDETGTFWVIKDGLANTVTRAMYWPAQSPLYYLTAWLAFVAGGSRELVLRMPSLIAAALAAALLWKLAARLFDRPTARLAVLVFVCAEPVAFAAADARPYALALCLLIGAALMLACWLDTGRARYAAGYALLAALAIAAQCLTATALGVLALYALRRVRKERRVTLRALAACWIATGLLLLPLLAQWLRSYQSRMAHSFAGTPGVGELFAGIAPPILAVPIALGLLFAIPGLARLKRGIRNQSALLAIAWAVLPPLFCFAVSVSTDTKLFVPRYYISAAPGLALAAAWLIRRNAAGAVRRVIPAVVALAAILSFGNAGHGGEDWAGAMQAAKAAAGDSTIPVLVASGFIEASDPKALHDPRMGDAFFAPLAMYPAPGKVIRLPFRLDPQSIPYLERIVATDLEHRDRFLFICRWQGASFEPWLRGRLAVRGFHSQRLGDFGNVGVFLFSLR